MKQIKTESTQNGIVLTPSLLIAIVIMILNAAMGLGLWSVQNKIDDYDAYEPRITKIETSLIRLERVTESVESLTKTFEQYSNDRFTSTQGKMLADQIENIAKIVRDIQLEDTREDIRNENQVKEFERFKAEMIAEQTRQWARLNDLKSAIIDLSNDKEPNIPVER